jgi:hypothetical protein
MNAEESFAATAELPTEALIAELTARGYVVNRPGPYVPGSRGETDESGRMVWTVSPNHRADR